MSLFSQVAALRALAITQDAASADVEARVARLEIELSAALDAAVTSAQREAVLRRTSSSADVPVVPAPVSPLEARLAALEAQASEDRHARQQLEMRTKRLEHELAAALEAAVAAAESEARARQVASQPVGGGHEALAAMETRVARLEKELATALEAAVAAAAAESKEQQRHRLAPSSGAGGDTARLADHMRQLEGRMAEADATVRRCEQETMRTSAAAVSALTGLLAAKEQLSSVGGQPHHEDLDRLQRRMQALETAVSAAAASTQANDSREGHLTSLSNRVEELEHALEAVRDALRAMSARQLQQQQQGAAQTAQAQGLQHAQQRLLSLESRVEAAEAALTAATESASRAETAAAGAAVAAASARRAADEAPRAAAHAVSTLGLASPRPSQGVLGSPPPSTQQAGVPVLTARLRGCEANLQSVAGDAANTRHNVDALALVVEQLASRLDNLETDVAQALAAVAETMQSSGLVSPVSTPARR